LEPDDPALPLTQAAGGKMTQRHVANIALRQQQQCSNEQRSRVVYPQKRKISAQSHRLSDSKLSFRFRPICSHSR
jgi:hypothetical protein